MPNHLLNIWRYVGLRHLTEKPLRTFLSVLGVVLGFSLFVAIKLINQSTLSSFEENVHSITGNAALTVTGGEAGFPETKLARVEAVPGVKSAVPLVEAKAYLLGKNTAETLTVFGVDMLREGTVRKYQGTKESPVEDFLSFLNEPDSLIFTKAFAVRHGLAIDSPLELMTALGARRFTVRGFLSPTGLAKAFGGNLAIMDIDGARAMFGKVGKVDRIDVTMARGTTADVGALETRLERTLGPGYQVERPEAQTESMDRMVSAFQKFLSFISVLALAIGLFMVAKTISVSVSEKRVEIGSLRALGTTRAGILQLFLGEAAMMGAVGGFFGATLGALFAARLGGAIAQTMTQQSLTTISEPVIHFGWRNLLEATVLGAGISALSALRPAREASRIQPIEAIRRNAEPVREGGLKSFARTFLWGAFAAGLIFVLLPWERTDKTGTIELAIQILMILAINLTAPLLAYGVFSATRRLAKWLESAVGRLALENLVRNPRRAIGNVLVLKVGLILFVTVTTVRYSFHQSILNWLDRALQSDLVVSSYGNLASFQTQPLDENIEASIGSLPTVRKSLALPLRAMRFIHLKVDGKSVALKAYDEPPPSQHYSMFDVREGQAEEAGRRLFHSDGPTVFLSTNLARRWGKSVGDRLAVPTPAGNVDFSVAGVVNDFTSGDGVMVMDRAVYRKYWQDGLISLVYLKLLPGADAEKVRNAIDVGLGTTKSLQVTMNGELKSEVSSAIDRSFSYLHSIELASLSIALLALLNSLLISIIERKAELGLLRAAGMSRPQLFGMIFIEAIVQGLAAVGLAVAMGSLLSALWITHSLESLLGWSVPYYFPLTSILGAGALGVGVACLAAIYPASRAAFLPITEAISGE